MRSIREHTIDIGEVPSIRRIGQRVGLSSPSSVAQCSPAPPSDSEIVLMSAMTSESTRHVFCRNYAQDVPAAQEVPGVEDGEPSQPALSNRITARTSAATS